MFADTDKALPIKAEPFSAPILMFTYKTTSFASGYLYMKYADRMRPNGQRM